MASGKPFLRFGARHCIEGCFNKERDGTKYFCRHGREMGWCCGDDNRFECKNFPEYDMVCNYNIEPAFYEDLKYFSCIRDSKVCGSSADVHFSLPAVNQTLEVEEKQLVG